MKPQGVRFEARPQYRFWGRHSSSNTRLAALICGALLLAYACWLGYQVQQAMAQTQRLQAELVELDGSRASKTANESPANETRRSISIKGMPTAQGLSNDARRNLNLVIRRLNTPWQDLFDQLEKSTPGNIALLSIEPDAVRETIKLHAEATALEPLLIYAASLEKQGVFGQITYSKYETNEQDANKPKRLTFELALRKPQRLESAVSGSVSTNMRPPGFAQPLMQK